MKNIMKIDRSSDENIRSEKKLCDMEYADDVLLPNEDPR